MPLAVFTSLKRGAAHATTQPLSRGHPPTPLANPYRHPPATQLTAKPSFLIFIVGAARTHSPFTLTSPAPQAASFSAHVPSLRALPSGQRAAHLPVAASGTRPGLHFVGGSAPTAEDGFA